MKTSSVLSGLFVCVVHLISCVDDPSFMPESGNPGVTSGSPGGASGSPQGEGGSSGTAASGSPGTGGSGGDPAGGSGTAGMSAGGASQGGGSGGTGASGGSSGNGGVGGGTGQSCDQCQDQVLQPGGTCSQASDACASSPSCTGFIDCLKACSTQTCVNQCGQNNPQGVTLYNNVVECICDDGCDTECAADCGGQGGSAGSGGGSSTTPTCNVPSTPPSGGACVAGQFACNPVTNQGCPAGSACDLAENGFACYEPPNDATLCGGCDNQNGPFCQGGSTCAEGQCAKFCCDNSDCGGTTCDKSVLGATAPVGLCVGAGSGAGGDGGAGGGSSGAGGSSGGAAGSGSEDLYCGVKESELGSISSCDDSSNACAAAMCATTIAENCKKFLLDCFNDEGCNKAVACGAVCREKEPDADIVAICTPLAGGGLAKLLYYKSCEGGLKACGGDDSIKPD